MLIKNGKFIKNTDVVISGISGTFPKSDNMREFAENLFSEKNLIENVNRWGPDCDRVLTQGGYIKTCDRFDHSFFRVHRNQAEKMDVAARILLEKAFEAIVDAGYNPEQLKGTNTGVYYGVGNHKLDDDYKNEYVNEFTLLGKFKSLVANRISYWLDIKGPSMTTNTGCCSTAYALDCAYKAIQSGECDAAIVCGSNVGLAPTTTLAYMSMGIIDRSGKCRPFDAEANGFIRAEAAVAIFLQKKENARRIYANVLHTKTNCDGFNEDGFIHPSENAQKELYRKFYNEIGINPASVFYVEAHGTGTQVGDVVEANAMEEIFCTGRNTSLKIGSVKSNMGHTEACSALSSIAKMIISFETGLIPPNLHFTTPHPDINAFQNGLMEVVTKPTPCEGDFFAICSHGIGGANGHILLSPNMKEKMHVDSATNNELPRLVTVSGRTEEAVDVIMNDLEKNGINAEYVGLLHEIFNKDIRGHLHRGYIVLNTLHKNNKKHFKYFSGKQRPIWFVFSGVGSQWPTMGKSLMKIPLFAESIQKSHHTLQNKGIDLIKIITNNDVEIFKNILNLYVGIAAIQIALVDVLTAIDIIPDALIGHSVGELGCAYSDGCFTAEQMILASYYRGLVLLESELIHGTMAAVGASYDQLRNLVPPEIDIACHNGPSNCTISGPTNIMENFIEKLRQQEKIFVRKVDSANIAYHSRYITPAASRLHSYMAKIIPDPKPRSSKWICTSAPEHEWNTDIIRYSSAEYHTNNLLSPVYFQEGSCKIPNDAITIEIAPHGLLQPILKRSLPATVNKIALTMKDHDNGVEFLFSAIGQLYELGCTPKISVLYPPIEFPVSRSTPMISPLIKWQHNEEWPTPKYAKKMTESGERHITINPQQDDFEYLRDYIVEDKNVFPVLGYLNLVWKSIALMQATDHKQLPVVFENVYFKRVTIVPAQGWLKFHISIQKGTGHFEIRESDATVASGIIRIPEDVNSEKVDISFHKEIPDSSLDMSTLSSSDFYQVIRSRGHHYKDSFRKIISSNIDGTHAKAQWCNNFVTFMDTMSQMTMFNIDTYEILMPTSIQKIVIDPKQHFEMLKCSDKQTPEFAIQHYPNFGLTCSGGIQMVDWEFTSTIPCKKNQQDPILEKYQFVPYINNELMDLPTTIRMSVQIATENLLTYKVKTLELLDQTYNPENMLISSLVLDAIKDIPQIEVNLNIMATCGGSEIKFSTKNDPDINIMNELPDDKSCDLIILSNISKKTNSLEEIFNALSDEGFVIAQESVTDSQFDTSKLNICFSRTISTDKKILLLRKTKSIKNANEIKIENTNYSSMEKTREKLSKIETNDERLTIYAEKEQFSGILGFFNSLRKEKNSKKIRCFYIMDKNAPYFSLQDEFYKSQFSKDLSHNVLKNDQWGSYRHLLLEPIGEIEVPHAYSFLEERGNLSSLKWVEGSLNPVTNKSSRKPLIHIYYSSFNFHDVMLAQEKISPLQHPLYSRLQECFHGTEYSGKDDEGMRHMGLCAYRGIASLVECEPTLTYRVPDHMTLEEASTIPMAYTTVVALLMKVNLREGSSVLIHSCSDAIGQAAVNICLHLKCIIFVTVDSTEKAQFIRTAFPQIPSTNIGKSKNTSLEKLIMKGTNGRGVDVVFNLSANKFRASVRCVAKYGHFINIGKHDMTENNFLEIGLLSKNINFHNMNMDGIMNAPFEVQSAVHNVVQEMLDNGIIKPIKRTVFEMNQMEVAFRFLSTGKYIGKVVIRIRDEEKTLHAKPAPLTLKALPRVLCQENSSYLIIGHLDRFHLELADWLIIRGARNIVLGSQNCLENGYQSYKIKLWESYGVNVIVCTGDITNETGVANTLQAASASRPVQGIFNVSEIFYRNQVEKQVEDHFSITVTQHLDKLSRQMCPNLEYFVVFSCRIFKCGNLAMSNSIGERICEARKADHLPALAIQWGVIEETDIITDAFSLEGVLPQKIASCLRTLDGFMKQPHSIVSSIIVAPKHQAETDIVHVVANMLGFTDLTTLSLTWTLPELGMDSIMIAQLQKIFESDFDISLTVQHFKSMTFAELYQLEKQKKLVKQK